MKEKFDEYIGAVIKALPEFVARAKLLRYINKNIRDSLPHMGTISFGNEHGVTITEDEIHIPISFILKIKLKDVEKDAEEDRLPKG
jgi:hypothetical protein